MNRKFFVDVVIYTIVGMAYILLMLAVHHGSTELTPESVLGAAIVGGSTGIWRRQPFLGPVVLTIGYISVMLVTAQLV